MATRNEILDVLRLAEDAGVVLSLQFRAPSGWGQCVIDRALLAECIETGRIAAAAALGLSDDEYLEWVENDGGIRCMAKTRKGARCRCFVTGSHYSDATRWKAANAAGGYCSIHGEA